MNTVIRYTKAFFKKVLSAAAFTVLTVVKMTFKVTLFFFKLISIPFIILGAINGATNLCAGAIDQGLISFGIVAILVALRFILPAALPMIDSAIGSLRNSMHRPLVYKSRLTYTLG